MALTRCSDYAGPKIAETIAKQFNLLGGLEKFISRGDSVLLKPNFIMPKPRRCAAQTDPAILLETARLLKDFGAKPFIGDSPAWGNITACVKALKFGEEFKKLAIPVKQLDRPKTCLIGPAKTKVRISSVALDADVIINLPKFKSHQQMVATFAVKNMYGCVSGKQKAWWHFAKGGDFDDFCELLIGIYKLLNPALTIIDAVTVMDGTGPVSGRARHLGCLIGSTDPVACEIICSKLIKLNPDKLPIVRTAKKTGFGTSRAADIKTLGEVFSDCVCDDFRLPEPIPLRFSMSRVCKSIAKQLLFLAGSAVKKGSKPETPKRKRV
ncbi:MAG: DUF362 domain-containing protein [Planctomycetota bacterium]